MDCSSGDVRPAIVRPAVAVGGGASFAASALLRGWREFRRSAAPARFLCFEEGQWVDVVEEAAPQLRLAFQEGKAMAETAYGERVYLFDFLRKARIDAATGEETAMGWIDDHGSCFFPAPDCGGRKRKRDDDAAAEDEAESSSGVDERSGESRGVDSGAKKREARGAWGSEAVKLEENDKYYRAVSGLFFGCDVVSRSPVITAVRKIVHCTSRAVDFQKQGELLAAARGAAAATPKFAWYGASADDVAALIDRGFVRTNAPRLGARKHGDGVHLSLPQYPHTSAMLAREGANRETHIVLCRVLIGNQEVVPAGSSQSRPSSDEYDTAVDKLENPRWYVVWSKDRNTRILPEYVVSFKFSKQQQQTQESLEATSKLKTPSAAARDMFPRLLAEIEQLVPHKFDEVNQAYNSFKSGRIQKEVFLRFLRNYIGDQTLTAAAKKLRGC